jgi:hypothetical protein
MIRRQPVPHRRRQQKRLLTITFDEVLGHTRNPTGRPGRNPLCDSHRAKLVCDSGIVEIPATSRAGPCPGMNRTAV